MTDSKYNYIVGMIFSGFIIYLSSGCISENLTPPRGNQPPVILGLDFTPDSTIALGDTVWITCNAVDEEEDSLVYRWRLGDGGLVDSTGMTVRWWAGGTEDYHPVRVIVSDSLGADTLDFKILVVERGSINYPPVISNLSVTSSVVAPLDTVQVTADISDDRTPLELLEIDWSTSLGNLLDNRLTAISWKAPAEAGTSFVSLRVADDLLRTDLDSIAIIIDTSGNVNHAPTVEDVFALSDTLSTGESTRIFCQANDRDGDEMSYEWSASAGTITDTDGDQTNWTAPWSEQLCSLYVKVSDGESFGTGYTLISVLRDTVILYSSDFSSDDVTGNWQYQGLLTGLGDTEGVHSIEWDGAGEHMIVMSRSSWGTNAYRMADYRLQDARFRITVQASDTQFNTVGFLPKCLDENNYVLIDLNYFLGQWQVLQCIQGTLIYSGQNWRSFPANTDIQLEYTQYEGNGRVLINGAVVWSGEIDETFSPPLPMGVAVSGQVDSGIAFYDNLIVTDR